MCRKILSVSMEYLSDQRVRCGGDCGDLQCHIKGKELILTRTKKAERQRAALGRLGSILAAILLNLESSGSIAREGTRPGLFTTLLIVVAWFVRDGGRLRIHGHSSVQGRRSQDLL